jgi:hypothetical protein
MVETLTAIDELSIVGVRPKPEGLSASLQGLGDTAALSTPDILSLQQKGFFITRDGQLMSNEGELQVSTDEGIVYTLRFGEVLYGTGLEVSAGTGDSESQKSGGQANRYLFLTARFDPSLLPEPPKVTDTSFIGVADSLLTDAQRELRRKWQKHRNWENDLVRGAQRADELNSRFADWYYVIAQDSFEKLHVKREDLLIHES